MKSIGGWSAFRTHGYTGADVTRPTTTERSLTEEERADLMARAAKARSEARQVFVRTGGASVAICGMLAAITTVASDAPNTVILGFWATLACVFTVCVGGPWRKLMRGQVMALDDALGTAERARSGSNLPVGWNSRERKTREHAMRSSTA
jgi:hypothetical protein